MIAQMDSNLTPLAEIYRLSHTHNPKAIEGSHCAEELLISKDPV
jgi:hypothetical protein